MNESAPSRRARGARGGDIPRGALIRALDEAHRGPAWHGPALLVTLRHCSVDEACHRIARGRNTIWELVLHAAYGKHRVRVRLTGDRRRFPRALARDWWPVAPDPTEAQWNDDLALLDDSHRWLVEAVAEAEDARLARRRPGRRHTMAEEILGIALHDTYHGGQITLIRKLFQAR